MVEVGEEGSMGAKNLEPKFDDTNSQDEAGAAGS